MDAQTQPHPSAPTTGAPIPGTPIVGTPIPPGAVIVREEVIERDRRRWPLIVAFPVGVAAALVGIAPWLLAGAQLPLQNLWAVSTTVDAMPFALLPFSQYYVIQIFSFLILGAAVAGVAGRAMRLRGWASALLVLGVLATQTFALVQTSLTVRDGLRQGFESVMYLGGLAGGTTLTILAGVAVTMLIVAAPRAGALLGLTAGAIAATSWTTSLLLPIGTIDSPLADAMVVVPWVAPVLTGIAIAWTGVHSVGRVIATITALAMVWVAPAVTSGIGGALGTRVLLTTPGDLAEHGVLVFQTALFTPEVALHPVLATLAVAAVGLLVRGIVALARRGRS